MGQYYRPVLSKEPFDMNKHAEGTLEIVAFDSWDYSNGLKMMEHAYVGNNFVAAVENYLTAPHYIIWAGDYAEGDDCPAYYDKEYGNRNWYSASDKDKQIKNHTPEDIEAFLKQYPFIVNHTKKVYVKRPEFIPGGFNVHPLPLLTTEKGGGGGDYRGKNDHKQGIWARDLIQVTDKVPGNYQEIKVDFYE